MTDFTSRRASARTTKPFRGENLREGEKDRYATRGKEKKERRESDCASAVAMQFEYLLRTCTQVTSRSLSFSPAPFLAGPTSSTSLSLLRSPAPRSPPLSLSYFPRSSPVPARIFFCSSCFFLRNPFIASYKAIVTLGEVRVYEHTF